MAQGEDDAIWSELKDVHQAFHFATNNEFLDCAPDVLLACIDYEESDLDL